jgi:hypothetical protein
MEQSFNLKKVMSILLVAFFVVSLTAAAASAHGGGYGCCGCGWGGYPWGMAYPYYPPVNIIL